MQWNPADDLVVAVEVVPILGNCSGIQADIWAVEPLDGSART